MTPKPEAWVTLTADERRQLRAAVAHHGGVRPGAAAMRIGTDTIEIALGGSRIRRDTRERILAALEAYAAERGAA